MEKTIIGARGSKLSMIQADMFVKKLHEIDPERCVETTTIKTHGDKDCSTPLHEIGEVGVFTKHIESCLIKRDIHMAVHSFKDVPHEISSETVICAILERENPQDLLIFRDKNIKNISELPPKSVVGTSSLRRRAQLLRNYPNITVKDIRGNLTTRISKLDDLQGDFDAIVLAYAGLKRFCNIDRNIQLLGDDFFYAIGQGAIAIQCRLNDDSLIKSVAQLTHLDTALMIICERELMRTLRGGCCVPLGVKTYLRDNILDITCSLMDLSGQKCIVKNVQRKLPDYSIHNKSPYNIIGNVVVGSGVFDAAKEAFNVGTEIGNLVLNDGGSEILQNLPHRCLGADQTKS